MRIIYIISLSLLIGCKATKQASYTAEKSSEKRQDSLVYIERLRIDTVKLKGDSVRVRVPIPCPPIAPGASQATKEPFGGRAKSGRVNLTYAMKDGMLEIDCNADSLMLELIKRDITVYKLERQIDSANKQTVVTVTNTVTRYRTPFWNWVVMLALLCWIFRWQIVDGVKMIAKIPLPWK
jgi:hypothetical protein